MEFIEEDEILPDIEIREFLSIEKILEFDPKFVQSSYEEIVDLISELLKNSNRARVFADLHKSIINPTEKILTDYTKFKVELERRPVDERESYIIEYNNANKADYYNLQQTQKSQIAMPFNITDTSNEDESKPVLNTPGTLVLSTRNDTSKLTESDCINNTSIPVDGIAWQPLTYTDESLLITNISKLPSSKFINHNINKDPNTLHEWIEKKIEPTLKTTLENHLAKIVKKYKSNLHNQEYTCDTHSINLELKHDGYKLEELTQVEFELLVNILETLDSEFNEINKKSESLNHNPKNLYPINKLSKYVLFWDFLTSFKFPLITDEYIMQLRERCGNYTMANNTYNSSESEIRNKKPYKMAMDILNDTITLTDLLEYIESYRSIITYNRIKNLLDDSPKTTIEQMEKPVSYIDVLDLIKQFKQTEKSINPEKRKPFLDTYNEIAEFVLGNDTQTYDGTPFVAAQGSYDEDFEMGLLDDVLLVLDPLEGKTTIETGEDDAYDLIISKYSEKYNELNNCNSGTLEVLVTVLKQLITIREATGMKWNETQINEWIKTINTNDTIKMRMSRSEQIKTLVNDISDTIAQRICSSTEKNGLARIEQITNSDLRTKLTVVYPKIHKEWANACKTTLISGLAAFWLDSLEASVKGYLGFNILSGMVNFVNTWSPYGVPLEKENKVGKRGILYYIDAVASYVLKNNINYAEEILDYVDNHSLERLNTIKALWKTNSSKPIQSRAEQAVVSLVELINDLAAKRKVSRNTIINTFIKGFVYLPLQLPIEDWNKYRKLPAWDLGCCTAQIDTNYSADNDMKNNTKDLYKLKLQLARQRWNIEPRKNYKLFLLKHKTHDKKDKKQKPSLKDEESKHCKLFYKPEIIIETIKNNLETDRFNFIFENSWFPETYVSNMLKDPKVSILYAQQIISRFINNQTVNDINAILVDIKDIGSIINIIVLLIKNLYTLSNKYKNDSNMVSYNIYNDAMNTILLMKDTLIRIQTTFKGDDYKTVLYFSKYILALAFALPGQTIYVDKETVIDIPDGIDIDEIITSNYKLVISWNNIYKMPTVADYNDYINKKREESKIKTMAVYNALQDDDLQLMKDMKRFGLKVEQPVEINPSGDDQGNAENLPDFEGQIPDNVQDYEGEREFYPEAPDREMDNDERI